MKTIIAGSRSATYPIVLAAAQQCPWWISEVVSGTARGADQCGEQLAQQFNLPVTQFPADWDGEGKKAGYMRNIQMANYAEAALICWDGSSKGTRHMINEAIRMDLKTSIWVFHHDIFDPTRDYIKGEWHPSQPLPCAM